MSRRRITGVYFILTATTLILSIACDSFMGVEGQIRDPNGRPVEGAKITVSRGGEVIAEGKSNTNGYYAIFKSDEPLIFNRTLLSVSKDGFKTYQKEFSDNELYKSGNELYKFDVTLEPPDRH